MNINDRKKAVLQLIKKANQEVFDELASDDNNAGSPELERLENEFIARLSQNLHLPGEKA